MSGSRWNRRETIVAQAGYFTVLRSSGWFSTLRLPGGFRYLIKGQPTPPWLEKPGGAKASPEEQSRAGGSGVPASLLFRMPKTCDRSLGRMVLIAFAGAAATCGLLWWFWHIAVRGAS
jgi:hypothetical protein